MTAHRIRPLQLPEHWTPAEALAVFEMIDLLRDQIWSCYGHDIQQELRAQIDDRDDDRDPRQDSTLRFGTAVLTASPRACITARRYRAAPRQIPALLRSH